MSQDLNGIQNGNARDELREAIIELGLNFRLMTQFTSFVAVEEMTVTDAGVPRRIEVPVEMPEGVSHRGVFGEGQAVDQLKWQARMLGGVNVAAAPPASRSESVMVSSDVRVAPSPRSKAGKSPARGDKGGGIGPGDGLGVGSGRGSNTGAGSPGPGSGGGVGAGSRPPTQELSPEERQRRILIAKTNPAIAALIERLKKNVSTPAADESKFVRNGKAEVQVWLTDKSPETLSQLKRLACEIVLEPKSQKLIIGRIALEKLSELVNLTCVTYVSPMKST
jgi:hypothetical protein